MRRRSPRRTILCGGRPFASAPSLFGGPGDAQTRTAAAKPAIAGLPDLMALLAGQVQPLRPVVLFGSTEAAHILAGDRPNRRGGRTNEHCGCNQYHGLFQDRHSLSLLDESTQGPPTSRQSRASDNGREESSRRLGRRGEIHRLIGQQWYHRTKTLVRRFRLTPERTEGSLPRGDGGRDREEAPR
jgi:hypothetical protein